MSANVFKFNGSQEILNTYACNLKSESKYYFVVKQASKDQLTNEAINLTCCLQQNKSRVYQTVQFKTKHGNIVKVLTPNISAESFTENSTLSFAFL